MMTPSPLFTNEGTDRRPSLKGGNSSYQVTLSCDDYTLGANS